MTLGDQVGQYRVTQLLGEGGMGAVYKAVDTLIEREVAIKVLRPEIGRNANLLQRFRAEAVTVAKLNHAGIATLYSFQQNGDEFLMIMEYVPGKTLEAIERERGVLPVPLALPIFLRILEAIGPAHDSGILHRDIKPANIMLTTWGAIKVMDFGIARIAGAARQTREGALVGTMEYIAPERVKGSEGDIASDIYALGVVLFEMLSGQLPFSSPNEYDLMKMHLEGEVPTFASLNVAVPPPVEALVRRSLAKDPATRFATCEDFADALRAVTPDAKISRADIVALVGKPVVEELGTAGHHSSISGGIFPPAGPQATRSAAASTTAGSTSRAPVAGQSFLRQYKVPLAAAAALLLAIGGGVGLGKLVHTTPAPAPDPPAVTQPTSGSDLSGNPGPSSGSATVPAPATIATPTLQTLPAGVTPVQETPEASTTRSARPPKVHKEQTAREKALKALEE